MKKFSNQGIRKITKTGSGSYYVILPKAMIKALGWQERQKVVVKKTRSGLRIVDWEK